MEPHEPSIRPRAPVASGALLSAALGGLLCFAPACSNGGSTAADTGTNLDTGARPDTGGTTDTGVDAAVIVDATGDVALDAATDAQPDSALDASALDVVIASDTASLVDVAMVDAVPEAAPPCDVAADLVITYSDTAPGITLDTFTANCTTLGGFVEIAPECAGRNTCRGISYDQENSTLTEHTCAGLNTCQGFSCVLP